MTSIRCRRKFIAQARSAFEVPTRPLPSDPHPHRCSFQLQPAKSSIKREYHENSRFTSLCILSNIAISSDFAEFKDKSENESVSYLADVVGELWKSLVFWRWELSGGPNKTFWVPFFSMAPTSSSSILKLTVDCWRTTHVIQKLDKQSTIDSHAGFYLEQVVLSSSTYLQTNFIYLLSWFYVSKYKNGN